VDPARLTALLRNRPDGSWARTRPVARVDLMPRSVVTEAVRSSSRRAARRPPPAPGFRPDIQGLRAVAVGLVLLYHTGLGPDGGFLGVDVFFVLSGFLITGLLAHEQESTGRIDLVRFWARRARRLLPASVLVLLVTCAAARWLLPAARWESIGQDAVAAGIYVINWRLAAGSVDYLAEGAAPGPLQHFWSLAVEEQFYLFWPLLITVLSLGTRRLVIGATAVLAAGSLAVALASPGAQTYFTTHTRIWELAAGALCALTMPRPGARHARRSTARGTHLRAGLGWAGLLLLLATLTVVGPATTWPGPLTVPVVLASVLLLRYGREPAGPGILLGWAPLTWIGNLSYALYLWHWPLVVLVTVDAPISVPEGVGVLVAATGLSMLTHRLVEAPARTARFWAADGLALAGGAVLAVFAVLAGSVLTQARSVADPVHALGAAADITVQASARALAPRPEEAGRDNGEIYDRGCPSNYTEAAVHPCVFDHRTGAASPTVAVVGDSKAGQWVPAMEEIARRRHWRLVSITKAGCAFSSAERVLGRPPLLYDSCITWNQAVLRQIAGLRPDLVLTTQLGRYPIVADGKRLSGSARRARMIRGLGERLAELAESGIAVAAFAQTPQLEQDAPDCVSVHLDDLAACARSRPEATAGVDVVAVAAQRNGVPVLDLTDRLCTPLICPAVIGDVIVYRDRHHLTGTYSRSLGPFVEQQLAAVLEPGLRDRLFAAAPP